MNKKSTSLTKNGTGRLLNKTFLMKINAKKVAENPPKILSSFLVNALNFKATNKKESKTKNQSILLDDRIFDFAANNKKSNVNI
ncbi:MAG: hypothetical protein SFV55_27910 [Haliscomenobacter sp.]|uniref:hypothetical protein n=1 Tax=Haliscomenobacter sp. TaxID=2717303 RepID=UPI0029AEB6C3|nr:hypothetical protein [Haliscomenobacter sp.]MDX2072292.1 hypothetical protein [Haliscomenobacter sp.]